MTDDMREKEAVMQFLAEMENDFRLEAKSCTGGRKDLHYANCCKLIRELIGTDEHWLMPGGIPRYV